MRAGLFSCESSHQEKPSCPVPIILEVALNGFTGASGNPALPAHARRRSPPTRCRCLDAGASIVHTHLDEFALPAEEAAVRYHEAYRPDPRHATPLRSSIPPSVIGEKHRRALRPPRPPRQGRGDPCGRRRHRLGQPRRRGPTTAFPSAIDFVYVNSLADVEHEMVTCAPVTRSVRASRSSSRASCASRSSPSSAARTSASSSTMRTRRTRCARSSSCSGRSRAAG